MTRASSGVTLLELMIVLVLMALIAAVTIPIFGSGVSTTELRSAARELAAGLRLARGQAIAQRTEATLELDVGARNFRVPPDPRVHALPTGIELKLFTAQRDLVSDNVGAIRFSGRRIERRSRDAGCGRAQVRCRRRLAHRPRRDPRVINVCTRSIARRPPCSVARNVASRVGHGRDSPRAIPAHYVRGDRLTPRARAASPCSRCSWRSSSWRWSAPRCSSSSAARSTMPPPPPTTVARRCSRKAGSPRSRWKRYRCVKAAIRALREDGKYSWATKVEAYVPPGTTADLDRLGQAASVRLWRISVSVSWPGALGNQRSVSLATVRLATKQP